MRSFGAAPQSRRVKKLVLNGRMNIQGLGACLELSPGQMISRMDFGAERECPEIKFESVCQCWVIGDNILIPASQVAFVLTEEDPYNGCFYYFIP